MPLATVCACAGVSSGSCFHLESRARACFNVHLGAHAFTFSISHSPLTHSILIFLCAQPRLLYFAERVHPDGWGSFVALRCSSVPHSCALCAALYTHVAHNLLVSTRRCSQLRNMSPNRVKDSVQYPSIRIRAYKLRSIITNELFLYSSTPRARVVLTFSLSCWNAVDVRLLEPLHVHAHSESYIVVSNSDVLADVHTLYTLLHVPHTLMLTAVDLKRLLQVPLRGNGCTYG